MNQDAFFVPPEMSRPEHRTPTERVTITCEKGPACARPFLNIERGFLPVRGACRALSRTAAGIADRERIRQVGQQLRLGAEHCSQGVIAADLVAPGRRTCGHATNADR